MTTNTKQKVMRSPLIIRKENELKALKEERKKINTQLKSNKTRLQNLKTQIEDIHRKIQTNVMDKYQRCVVIKDEIISVLKKIKRSKAKRFSQIDKMQAEILCNSILDDNEDIFDYDSQDMEFDFEESANEREEEEQQQSKSFSQMFEQFQEKPSDKEHRKIRKVFLSLANRYHPDKARSKHEQEVFHNIMQRLNAAYKRGDIAELFEIKKLIDQSEINGKFEEKSNFVEEEAVEYLQREIDQISIEIEFLNNQLSRTKKEIRRIRNSDLGYTLKQEKKAQRCGGETVDAMQEEIDNYYESICTMRDEIQVFYKTGNWSKKFMEQVFSDADDDMPFAFAEDDDDDDIFFEDFNNDLLFMDNDDEEEDDQDLSLFETLGYFFDDNSNDDDDDDFDGDSMSDSEMEFMQSVFEDFLKGGDLSDLTDDNREFSKKDLNSKNKKKNTPKNKRRKRKKHNKRR